MSRSSREGGLDVGEATAFLRATDAIVGRFDAAADGPRPVVLPSYGDTRQRPDPTPLLALLLRRYGVPVLIHGPGDGDAAAAHSNTRKVMLELGIEAARDPVDAKRMFTQYRIAYVPLPVLAPGFATLLRSRARLDGPLLANDLAALIDPFHGDGYRVVEVASPDRLVPIRDLLIATRARAMLHAVEEESGASGRRFLRIETFADGVGTPCAENEALDPDEGKAFPAPGDAVNIAAWIAQVLAGSMPVPASVIAQLACCLAGSRRPFP